MAININTSKSIDTVVSFNDRILTVQGSPYNTGDFNSQRYIGLWDNSGTFKGLSWVRRFVSGNQLELETNFLNQNGNFITVNNGDIAHLSLIFEDVSQNNLTLNNNIITQNDNVIFGTPGQSDSVCFYDEAKTIVINNDRGNLSYRFDGGLVVFGHLLDYNRRTFFNPVNVTSSDGGSAGNQINVNNLSAKVWWLGGTLKFAITPARLPGGSVGSPAEWQKWWGIETNADIVTPSGGAPWSSNAENQQFINCVSLPSSNNAIGFRVSDSDFQGGVVKISSNNVISAFGADANGTYTIGAPSDERLRIIDIGNNPARTTFWRSSQIRNQTITVNNIISTDYRLGVTNNPGTQTSDTLSATINFIDSYNNVLPTTKIVIRETNNNIISTSGESINGENLELSVLYGTVIGHDLTIKETDWNWGAITYNNNIVSGDFSIEEVPTLSGNAVDVKHGATLIQPVDLNVTELNKSIVDGYSLIENSFEFYDVSKAFLVDTYSGEVDTLVNREGNIIVPNNLDVTINPNQANIVELTKTESQYTTPNSTRPEGTSDSLNYTSTVNTIVNIEFTTSGNVVDNQIVWESGATGIGTALIISNNLLEVYAGNNDDLYGVTSVSPNTTYHTSIVYDLTNNEIRLYLTDDDKIPTESNLISMSTFTQNDWCGGDDTGVGRASGNSVRGNKLGVFTGTINSPLRIWSNSNDINTSYILGIQDISIKSNDFTGTINTTRKVTDNGLPRTINYGVLNGDLEINNTSNEWNLDGPYIIDNLINTNQNDNLTIVLTNGSTVSSLNEGTGNGQVNIVREVPINVLVTNINNEPLSDVRVFIRDVNDRSNIILFETTNTNGEISGTYRGPLPISITGWARKSSQNPFFKQSNISGVINILGFNTNVLLIFDE